MNPARPTTAAVAGAVVLMTAAGLLVAANSASAATTCASPVYRRQFFANTTFSGTPKKTDCDTAIDQNWGTGTPASGLPTNNFGVRWTVTRDFGSGGPFALPVATQDGIRVYLDGTRKVDLWKNVSSTVTKTVNITIPAGKHTLRVDYVNWTGTANIKFAYTPRTSATVDKVKPLTPTGTAVTYDKATGKAKLTWTKNKELDLASYRVYRRLQGSTTWTKLTTTTATSYINTPPANGDTYFYEVRAIDKAGNESTGSADRSVATPDKTPPAVPTGVTAVDEQPGIALAWNAAPGAASYVVHRRWETDGNDEPTVKVATVASASWTDATAREYLSYSYWVTAVDSAGNLSAKSAPVFLGRGDHAPSAPTSLAGTTVANGIALTWRAPTTPFTEDLWSYRIYRKGRLVEQIRATQTSFTDTEVRQGTAYEYTVTAVDIVGNESVASAPATATAPATGLSPAPVAGLRGYLAPNGNLELTWQRSSEEDVDHYAIYRGVQVDGVWQYVKWWYEVSQPWTDDEPPYYVHEFLEGQGETARWAVLAVDKAGNSLFSTGEDFSYVTVIEPEITE
ncbi:PA14 domain-containing protein [Streptomyces sp. NBC_00243]|uniref:fibronectin type III domain-containing protein n=1 Tax=Streptomyces sp. NBC_00243 TaxID=2975688 RepID=UPI002DD85B89|nr:PA14 domain-containing protein [Streptomyces sp. NBC_00243]WRZ20977.1 PA14 domain-containing protein [Streptomyces sp. NBC_00243]